MKGPRPMAGGRWQRVRPPPAQPGPGVTLPGRLWVKRVPLAPQPARAGQEPAQLAPAQQIILEALAGTGTSQNSHVSAVGPQRGREQPAPLPGLCWQPLPRRGRQGWPLTGGGGCRAPNMAECSALHMGMLSMAPQRPAGQDPAPGC